LLLWLLLLLGLVGWWGCRCQFYWFCCAASTHLIRCVLLRQRYIHGMLLRLLLLFWRMLAAQEALHQLP
jgi:hypothetical protein